MNCGKQKKIPSIIVLTALLIQISFSQSVYTSIAQSDTARIGLLNLKDCSFNVVYENPTTHGWSDLAYCPNGKLYGTIVGTDEIDLANNSHIRLYSLPLSFGQEALVCSCDTVLYGTGTSRDLFSYNIASGEFRNHGKLPDDLHVYGDLFFYNDELYGTSEFQEHWIVKVDVENPSQSYLVYAPTSRFITGLYLQETPCEGALFYTQWSAESDSGDIREEWQVGILDPITFTESRYCSYFYDGTINGWAWEGEWDCGDPPPPCEIHIDLDENDSQGLAPIDFADTIPCPGGIGNIGDTDALVMSDAPPDSLVVEIVAPTATIATLDVSSLSGISVSGAGSGKLVLSNSGGADVDDFSSVLRMITCAPDPTLSDTMYTIAVTGYVGDTLSPTAYAYLRIGSPYKAGDDVELSICRDSIYFDLSSALPPNADPGGDWVGAIATDGSIYLPDFTGGQYYYIIEDPDCGPDSALWDITLHEPPLVSIGFDSVLCQGMTYGLGTDAPGTYLWQDGSTSDSLIATQSGYYWLEVTDGQGCTDRDSIFIEFTDDIMADTSFFLCTGQTMTFSGELLSAPGEYMIQSQSGQDCDTLWMVQIVGDESFQGITTSGELCHGNSVVLSVPDLFASNALWSTGHSGPQTNVTEAGSYAVMIDMGDGCILTDSVRVYFCGDERYYIPNVFSPNADGVNEEIHVYGDGIVEVVFEVFDRWGNIVFAQTGPDPVWDGTADGQRLLPGVYVYAVQIEFEDGVQVSGGGSVTLVR